MAKAQGTGSDELQGRARSGDGPSRGAPPPGHARVRLPIWVKMSAALIVPLLAVLLLSVIQVQQARDTAERVDRETELAAVALSPGGLVDALIIERGDAAVTTIGLRATASFPTKDFDESMARTDEAVKSLRSGVARGGPIAERAFAPVLEDIDEDLAGLRKRVAGVPQPPSLDNMDTSAEVYEYYSELVNKLSAANARLTTEITDPELRAAAQTLDSVNRTHDAISNVTQRVGIAYSFGLINDAFGRDDVVRKADRYDIALANLAAQGTSSWEDEVAAFAANERYKMIATRTQETLDGQALDLEEFIALSPQAGNRANPEKGTTQAIARAANKGLTARIDALRDDASTDERNYLALSVLVVLGATIIATLVARSVTKPMESLTQQARLMASTTLPAAVQSVLDTPPGEDVVVPEIDPIKVKTRDEVGVVADTLNLVQASALDLAVEQATLRRNIADSFVSLGRRTQNLIGLQLEAITELESDETDPAALEQLYRLDHLATRARRNAESLVVLAGTESPRTGGAPVPVTDVVRAMLSEVEAYQRVELVHLDDALVPGGTAADLIHLLAELVENGLAFSPPDKNVEVRGEAGPDGYVITVVDHGIGMPPDKIEQANTRLGDNETFTVAPSRYLGHYVTGKLAARVGAQVRLSQAEGRGILARVTLPPNALAEAGSAPARSSASSTPVGDPAGRAPDRAAEAAPGSTGTGDLSGVKVDGRPPALDQARAASGAASAAPAPQPAPADPLPLPQDPAPATGSDGDSNGNGNGTGNGSGNGSATPAETTSGGLRKRVPRSTGGPGQVREQRLRSGGTAGDTSAPAASVPNPQEAQNLASLLTAYTAGVERGRETEGSDESTDSDPDPLADPEPTR